MIYGYTDMFSSDDITESIEELEEELQDEFDKFVESGDNDERRLTFEQFCEQECADDWRKLLDLRELNDDIGTSSTIVNNIYFEEYTEDLAHQLQDIEERWPFNCIDWGEAASQLQNDYHKVEFDGGVFWYLPE